MTAPTPLYVRLTRLLDVIQRVHDCKRTVAARVVGQQCGISHRYVADLATRNAWCVVRDPMYYDAPLSVLESKYRAALVAHAKYEAACARLRVAA